MSAQLSSASPPSRLLDPGFELTLRPMRYPQFYEMYRNAIRNTWTVEEVDFSSDVKDLRRRAIGFVVALDGVLMGELPIDLDQGMISYPAAYFPRPTVLPTRIRDPLLLEEKLQALVSGDLSELAAKVPQAYRQPEAEDGLRTRAILLLGSTSTTSPSSRGARGHSRRSSR